MVSAVSAYHSKTGLAIKLGVRSFTMASPVLRRHLIGESVVGVGRARGALGIQPHVG